jgi:hypothetical protein
MTSAILLKALWRKDLWRERNCGRLELTALMSIGGDFLDKYAAGG